MHPVHSQAGTSLSPISISYPAPFIIILSLLVYNIHCADVYHHCANDPPVSFSPAKGDKSISVAGLASLPPSADIPLLATFCLPVRLFLSSTSEVLADCVPLRSLIPDCTVLFMWLPPPICLTHFLGSWGNLPLVNHYDEVCCPSCLFVILTILFMRSPMLFARR